MSEWFSKRGREVAKERGQGVERLRQTGLVSLACTCNEREMAAGNSVNLGALTSDRASDQCQIKVKSETKRDTMCQIGCGIDVR